MRVNVDGSLWAKFAMSFDLDLSLAADETELPNLCDEIVKLAKGEIEFAGSERPCVLHQSSVWRELEFRLKEDNRLEADVYVCCREFGGTIASSMPQIEAFIKKKLKISA